MLKYKWLITLVGVLALSVLVWFTGPYIAIADEKILASEVVRLLVIMVLVLAWGLNNLRVAMQARSGNDKLASEIQASELQTGVQTESEVQLLNARFKDAIETLRRSSGKSNRYSKHYLYDLPWYIIIGPPGTGKTTALVNSGLDFPLESQFGRGAIQGVGGTRHCDWWFTNQAVMIDTAGRYTTQDSHASTDATAWKGFIGLLKKYRKRRPINGVLVAISVDELVNKSEPERVANVNAVRARLKELKDQLGVNFPVYLLITKTDLIPGFNQYFDMIGKEERNQVWGITFPDQLSSDQNYLNLFQDEFDLLSQRLQDGVLTKFHFERDYRRRADILAFPERFAQLKPLLEEFVGRTFSESRFHDHYLLRGIYLTSGTQEGTGMQRIMQNMAGHMGMSSDILSGRPFPGAGLTHGSTQGSGQAQGKSFFLHNLFQHVVFPEAELAGSNQRYENKLRWARSLGYGATLAGATATTVFWSTSYGLNESRLNAVAEHLTDYTTQRNQLSGQEMPSDIAGSLQPLLAMREVYQPQTDGWQVGAGLYQGDRIAEHGAQEYERALQSEFLLALQHQIADQLQNNQDLPEYLHHALKAYLMLSLPQRLDKQYVEAWLREDWINRFADEPERLAQLNQHLTALLAMEWQPLTADEALVEQSRRVLRQVPLAQQIYASLKDKARQQEPLDYRFDTRIGNNVHYVFNGEFVAIPWFYTTEGYHDFFKPQQANIMSELADDSWVVGDRGEDMDDLELANVQAEIEKRYLDDYVGYWRSAVSSLRLQSTSSLDEHVRLLNEVLSGSSPLRRVLDEVVLQTQLSKPLLDAQVLADNAEEAGKLSRLAGSKASKLGRIARLAGRSRMVQLPEIPATLVDKRFEPLHDLMLSANGQSAPFERVTAALTELQFYLEGITSSGSTAQGSFDAAVARMQNGRSDPIGRLKVEARHLPDPVKQWVEALTDRAWGHTIGAARSHIAAEYNASVKPFYQRSLAGRYPLDKSAQVEVTLVDFAEFFKPGGIEQQFFDHYLAPFVDTRRSPWRMTSVDGYSLPLSKQSLSRFEQADRIRKAFFIDGDTPQVNFNLRVTYLDANINRFELDLLGEQLEYRHGPARRNELSWPAPGGQEQIRYVFEDHYGVEYGNQLSGTWGLFRFLDRFPLSKTGYADRFQLTVKDQERKAVYELHANSAQNPFGGDYLGNFFLPGKL